MKKFIGLLLIGGFLLSLNVSFASDVPETTKDCVVHADDTLVSDVQVNDVKAVSFGSKLFVSQSYSIEVVSFGKLVANVNREIVRFEAKTDYGLDIYNRTKLIAIKNRRNILDKDKFVPLLC